MFERLGPLGAFVGSLIFARTSFSHKVRTASLFSDRLFIRINDLAAFIFWRIDNDLGRQITEVVDRLTLDVLELGRQCALFSPFTLLAELHVAHNRLERGLA